MMSQLVIMLDRIQNAYAEETMLNGIQAVVAE